MEKKQYQNLCEKARLAEQNAYSPYSHFKVGAAVLSAEGKIYSGCNVENASYGLTNCAERTSLFKAVSEGERDFRALAVYTDTEELTAPCGACRQVIWELCGNIDILLFNKTGKEKVIAMKDLLPLAFSSEDLTS